MPTGLRAFGSDRVHAARHLDGASTTEPQTVS